MARLISNPNWHYHAGIQLYYSPVDEIEVETDDGTSAKGRLLLVPAHCVRRVKTQCSMIQFTINPYQLEKQRIYYLQRLMPLPVTTTEQVLLGAFFDEPNRLNAQQIKPLLWTYLLDHCSANLMDERLPVVLSRLAKQYQMPLDISALAAEACLSVSRLQHLFKQQVGISLSHYQQWLRLRMSFQIIAQQATPLEAALEAGFSDQAHFSKLFKRTFGYSPSDLLKRQGQSKIHLMENMLY